MNTTVESSPAELEIARKNESAILQMLASVGQARAAEAMSTSESTVSRWKSNGDIAQFSKLAAFLGLQVVPVQHVMVDPARLDALMLLAQDGVGAARAALANGKKP